MLATGLYDPAANEESAPDVSPVAHALGIVSIISDGFIDNLSRFSLALAQAFQFGYDGFHATGQK